MSATATDTLGCVAAADSEPGMHHPAAMTAHRPTAALPTRDGTQRSGRRRHRSRGLVLAIAITMAAAGCSSGGTTADPLFAPEAPRAETTETMTTLTTDTQPCATAFERMTLDHVTAPRGSAMAVGDGTGTGVLAEDLDGDGRIDLVLPNLAGPTSVWWNQGTDDHGLPIFEPREVATGRFRQAVTVDLDHDGHRDLLLTTGTGPLQAYLGGPNEWTRSEIRDFELIAYSVAPGDLEGDGDVDLAVGSYAAELTANRDPRAISGLGIGSAVYRPDSGQLAFSEELLATSAQALVTLIADVDGDGRQDVMAGNDLGTPDRIWLGSDRGLVFSELFTTTTLSTMSIDIADIDNDGDPDLVATDMAPMPGAPEGPWQELADDIEAARTDDIQQPRNIVQVAGPEGWDEQGQELGIEATGWSWSGVLGDLDNDGLLDLYVVNGMQAPDIFGDLPDGALVERNQARRNTGEGFADATEWALDDDAGGRGMAMADLDGDGDLDIVVNNLDAPTTVFLNRTCEGDAVVVELIWSATQNIDALGATVYVDDGDVVRQRSITGARGYLSTSPTRAHVGLGTDAGTVTISVRWPDGAITSLDDVEPGQLVTIERTDTAVGAEERP